MRLSTLALALALAVATLGSAPPATAVGPGGWDHLGTQVLSNNVTSALNSDVLAMNTAVPGQLLVAGKFTGAGGIAGADRIASWNGTAWSAVGPLSSFNGDINALAVSGGKIYAGGVFTNAGGNANADFLAVYDGVSWQPFCSGGLGGNVTSLQVIAGDLYVGGAFQDGGGINSADYLLRCNLTTGASSTTVSSDPNSLNGAVYALTADSSGNLYAGGGFFDVEGNLASDKVAMFNGTGWSNLGTGAGPGGGAVDNFVRSLASDGTNIYIGADSNNIAGIPQADHVARWNGSSWSAVGANAAGTDGYLPASTSIDALFASGTHVYATGNWLNVGGDPTADYLADFDGASWKPVGSNGAGNGALNAKGESITIFGGVLHVGGNFTSAGGDSLARFLSRFTGVPPSNAITLGKAKANQGNGTATLSVTVPGAGVLTLEGKGIKSQRAGAAGSLMAKPVAGAGTVKLKIKPKGKLRKKLRAHGKAKVTVTVTFTPTGGTAASVTKKVKLKFRH